LDAGRGRFGKHARPGAVRFPTSGAPGARRRRPAERARPRGL